MGIIHFVLQEVIFWRNNIESEIEDKEEGLEIEGEVSRENRESAILEQKELLSRVNEAMKARGVEDPDEEEEDAEEAEEARINSQEVDFTFLNAPGLTRQAKNRFAMQGTLTNALYARDNLARFEAYDEMERRARKLYDEISIEGYESLSDLVRCLD